MGFVEVLEHRVQPMARFLENLAGNANSAGLGERLKAGRGTADSIYDAGKFNWHAVAHKFHDTSVMGRKQRVNKFASVSLQAAKRVPECLRWVNRRLKRLAKNRSA